MFIFQLNRNTSFSKLTISEDVMTFYFRESGDLDMFAEGLFNFKALSCDLLQKAPVITRTSPRHTELLHSAAAKEDERHCHYHFKSKITTEHLKSALTNISDYIKKSDIEAIIRAYKAHIFSTHAPESSSNFFDSEAKSSNTHHLKTALAEVSSFAPS